MQRLKILLFMPDKVDAININHELASQLAHYLEAPAAIDFRTSIHGLEADALSTYDLVHILGCWDTTAVTLQQKAHRLHIPTVYSPLGGLQPWVIRKYRSSYRYAKQRIAIQHASAIHLCSKPEADTFSQLGWNRRWELIKNPVLTNRLSFKEMASVMLNFYQKILDSNARLLLSPSACQAIGHLLQLGIDKDVLFEQDHCKTMKENLAGLTETDWRRIFIYAADESITDFLSKGLERIQVTAPMTTVTDVDRFDNSRSYAEGDLPTEALCFKSTGLMDKLSERIRKEEKHEHELCMALLNLKHELEHHTAPLRHLANIYSFIRTKDMNEDRLKELTGDLGIEEWVACLMTVMHDVMRLSEGFMPFAAQDGRRAAKLKTAITKFNTWS